MEGIEIEKDAEPAKDPAAPTDAPAADAEAADQAPEDATTDPAGAAAASSNIRGSANFSKAVKGRGDSAEQQHYVNHIHGAEPPAEGGGGTSGEENNSNASSFYAGHAHDYGTLEQPLSRYGPTVEFNYNPIALMGPGFIFRLANTVFVSWDVWKNVLLVWSIMIVSALIMKTQIDDPTKPQEHEMLDKIIAFFRAFIAFMLGLYVSHAAGRFHTIVAEILTLFEHIKQIQTDLMMFGIPDKELHWVERYGVLSMRIFHQELCEIHNDPRQRLDEWTIFFDDLEDKGYIQEPSERRALESNLVESNADCSTLCWIWIQNLLMRLSVDGYVPPPGTPSFNALFHTSKSNAMRSIRVCKQLTAVQMPFGYAHMLAVLIHMNNWLMGLSAGVNMGVNVANFQKRLEEGKFPRTPLCNIALKFLYGGLFPFFFTGFLMSALLMMSPAHILPIAQLIRILEHDLLAQEQIGLNPPLWERPRFKAPPPLEK
ncbi:unnamed protein product [Amoebophrya sp. A25]|nr:unnamed protein product [Amoebophrya sp. A25]|eukprot:GSA25T00004494001.1